MAAIPGQLCMSKVLVHLIQARSRASDGDRARASDGDTARASDGARASVSDGARVRRGLGLWS